MSSGRLIDAGKGFAFHLDEVAGLIPGEAAEFDESIPKGVTCAVQLKNGTLYPYYWEAGQLHKLLTEAPPAKTGHW